MKIAKWKLIVSSLLVVLPGAAAAVMGGGFGGLAISALLLAAHLFCIGFTVKDPGNKNQSAKVFDLVLWIIPLLSIMEAVLLKALRDGYSIHPAPFVNLLMGLMALTIGNYLPKTRRNSTIGIKIKWTLENDGNWNATHRFGGKVWTLTGIGFLAAACFPETISMAMMFLLVAVMVILPTLYSYRYYRRQLAQSSYVRSETSLKGLSKKWTIGSLAAILILVALLMFTGEIHYSFGDESLRISATYYSGARISYDEITDAELLEGFDGGYRTWGFASGKLAMGNFRSAALGDYIRYTYTGCKTAVRVQAGNVTYILSEKTGAETQALYETLMDAIQP